MKTKKEYQLELAQTYRNEMYLLLERVSHVCDVLDSCSDEQVVDTAGLASNPAVGQPGNTWLSGPLEGAVRALEAIRVLNLARLHELELQNKENSSDS